MTIQSSSKYSYHSSYIYNRDKKYYGNKQDLFTKRSEEIVQKTVLEMKKAFAEGEKSAFLLKEFFFKTFYQMASDRREIAKISGTKHADKFGMVRKDSCILTPLTKQYADYGNKVLKLIASELSKMKHNKKGFDQRIRQSTTKYLDRETTFEIAVFNKSEVQKNPLLKDINTAFNNNPKLPDLIPLSEDYATSSLAHVGSSSASSSDIAIKPTLIPEAMISSMGIGGEAISFDGIGLDGEAIDFDGEAISSDGEAISFTDNLLDIFNGRSLTPLPEDHATSTLAHVGSSSLAPVGSSSASSSDLELEFAIAVKEKLSSTEIVGEKIRSTDAGLKAFLENITQKPKKVNNLVTVQIQEEHYSGNRILSTFLTTITFDGIKNPLTRMKKSSTVTIYHQEDDLIPSSLETISEIFQLAMSWDSKKRRLKKLITTVGEFAYYFALCSPFTRGSAAINEWFQKSIFAYYGYTLLVRDNVTVDLEALTSKSFKHFIKTYHKIIKLKPLKV